MKELKQYVCLVDAHRRPSRQRNTAGRYRVCAKTEKEAKELLQKAVGFGSVCVYYEITNPLELAKFDLKYKDIVIDYWDEPVRHATDPIPHPKLQETDELLEDEYDER